MYHALRVLTALALCGLPYGWWADICARTGNGTQDGGGHLHGIVQEVPELKESEPERQTPAENDAVLATAKCPQVARMTARRTCVALPRHTADAPAPWSQRAPPCL